MSRTATVLDRSSGATRQWVSCPRCEGDDPVAVVRSGDRLLGLPGQFQVVRCRRCGFLYTNPRPTAAVLARHYPPAYPVYAAAPARGAGTPDGLRGRLRAGILAARGYGDAGPLARTFGVVAARLFTERFLWLPPFVPGGTLVDVGSGTGAYPAEMRDLGWRVIGIEPDAGSAAAARDRFGIDVRTGTIEEAALPDACADVVVMRMVLEHVPAPRWTLAQARRILKPGGRLLVSVPNAGSIERRAFGADWYAWDLPRHLCHFTPASLGALVREAGFGGVRIRHLVNANNLAHSLRYRRGASAAPAEPRVLLRLAAALSAAARQSGRIAAEARRGPGLERPSEFHRSQAPPEAQSSTVLTQRFALRQRRRDAAEVVRLVPRGRPLDVLVLLAARTAALAGMPRLLRRRKAIPAGAAIREVAT